MEFVSATKLFEFEAAHHLPGYDGKCINLHGHSYKLEVEVCREIDEKSRMVYDFGSLSYIVKRCILNKLDHSNLNDFFTIPTAENVLLWIVQMLKLNNPEIDLCRVRLWETSKCYAEWRKIK